MGKPERMLYLSGVIIAFFLGVILLLKRNKSYADRVLALWLFVIGCHEMFFYLHFSNRSYSFPFLLGIEQPVPLLHGPFLFLYVNALTNPKHSLWKSLLHFLPFVAGELSLVKFLMLPSEEKILIYKSGGAGYETLEHVFLFSVMTSGVVYSILSYVRLVKHKKLIGELFSYTGKITLQWLQYLIIGLAGIWIVVIFGKDEAIFACVVVYLLFIGYFGINQVGIFTSRKIVEAMESLPVINNDTQKNAEISTDDPEHSPPVRQKYAKTGIDPGQLSLLHDKLSKLMEDEKLFLTAELVLTDVASKMNVHANTLSQVINSKEGKNFFNYINDLRIAEFKRKVILPENHHFTILALAFECGFNSKTAFNRNFRRTEGISPSDYLKKVHVQLKEE